MTPADDRGLVWSKTPPTVAGWFWVCHRPHEDDALDSFSAPKIVAVRDIGGQVQRWQEVDLPGAALWPAGTMGVIGGRSMLGRLPIVESETTRWAGPLTPPAVPDWPDPIPEPRDA